MELFPAETSTAEMSECGRYRFRLTRRWAEGVLLPFVMLNPSTADAEVDDPTIRRCRGFAQREGFAGLVVINLFPLRASKPERLLTADHKGREWSTNVETAIDTIAQAAADDAPLVCAWGSWLAAPARSHLRRHIVPITALSRPRQVPLKCLGTTVDGHPRHPLYVKADQPLVDWRKW